MKANSVCVRLQCHFYLHTPNQHCMKYMRSLLHDSHVFGGGVSTLAVLDGVDEAVAEFAQRAQQIPLDEVDHAVVCGSTNKCVDMKGLKFQYLKISLQFLGSHFHGK